MQTYEEMSSRALEWPEAYFWRHDDLENPSSVSAYRKPEGYDGWDPQDIKEFDEDAFIEGIKAERAAEPVVSPFTKIAA
jgi:hypothetical protein